MLGADGGLNAEVMVVRDVTAELDTERLKANFIATISHELRTPLTPLKGFLSALLQETVDDSPQARQEYYKIMMNQTSRLEHLITDLLEVSRIESGQPVVEARPVELMSLIGEHIREYASERLEESGRADELRRRHAEYFLALAEEAEPSILGLAPGVWLDRLERDHDNLRAALEWLEHAGEIELALRLGGAVWEFWCLRNHAAEG